MQNKFIFDRHIIEKYQMNAPRYTSYPTADRFNLIFDKNMQLSQIDKIFNYGGDQKKLKDFKQYIEPISLYIHIPFCNTLCLFCGCNKIITNKRNSIDKYLDYLEREIDLYYNLMHRKKLDVIQLHFGGGSPSWMDKNQVARAMTMIRKYFNLANAKEIAMEIDPRHCDGDYISHLHQNGFNRISLGIQDFNPEVQKAVNRIQSYEESDIVLRSSRTYGFKSSSVDLIYGLPFQTLDSFSETVDKIITMLPDRIALFNYAHIPTLLMPQTRINEADLPLASVKLDILQMSVERFTSAGYVFIGMDHFALPSDDLAIALQNGTLQRNFQGYSTFRDTNMLSFGISSIGSIGDSYYQNAKDINSYYTFIDNGELPILRGIMLDNDDIIRRDIIQRIMCQFSLDFNQIEMKYNIKFKDYFVIELDDLTILHQNNLIDLNNDSIKVTSAGRFLIRNVAVIFDKYFRNTSNSKKYSKVI
ncbi:MAG: oxygen-independent coproporphyrinogen III oxidase [Neisseriaceae bacterium]